MNLQEHRRHAAALSGGTSDTSIKALVIDCLRRHDARGPLLDFGAGNGELLNQLAERGTFNPLAGADIASRPAALPFGIGWIEQDLNEPLHLCSTYQTVVCSETIEHLENPRHVFRCLSALLRPGGLLVLTMPNQECIRSYCGLILGGHFTQFLGSCYPAHITALLRLDLTRLCSEVGFDVPCFSYSNLGGIPKLPRIRWQSVSFGVLKGRLFSDNVAMVTRKRRLDPT